MVKGPDTRFAQNPAMHERPPARGIVFQAEKSSNPGSRIARVRTVLSEVARSARSAVETPLIVGVGLAAVVKLHLGVHSGMPADLKWNEYDVLSARQKKVYEAGRVRAYEDLAEMHTRAKDTAGAEFAKRTAEVFRSES